MSDERDEIKARISIVDLVGQSIALKRSGKYWKGLCPFHPDKNPSFDVSETTGYYRCRACGENGDIFTWVMKTQNVEFPEALKILAERAGVTLKRIGTREDKSQREVRKAIMEEARAFFTAQLSQSETARAYLEKRGLDEAVAKTWELGYAADIDVALTTHLKKKGLPLQEAKSLFLAEEDSSGGFFDKFRGRLMFPIRDERGELVAFGGRLLGDGVPKYINSGDTPIFRKSRVLYGLYQSKDLVAKSGRAVLVEGYLDVIACHCAGVKTAVASLGTSLTEDHAKLLKRWASEVVVFYDGDAAGKKAAERALSVLNEAGNRVRVALLPTGQDPDTLLRSLGADAVQKAVDQGLSPLEFRLAMLEATLKPDQEDFWTGVVGALAECDAMPAVDAQVARLVHKYHQGRSHEIEEAKLRADVRRARSSLHRDRRRAEPAVPRAFVPDPISARAYVVFHAVLHEPLRAEAWPAILEEGLMDSEAAEQLALALRGKWGEKPPVGAAASWIGGIEDETLRELFSRAEDPRYSASSESLAACVSLLRSDRQRRDAEQLSAIKGEGADLAAIAERLKAAAVENPFWHFDKDPPEKGSGGDAGFL
ncbi:MAG: DNA primase [Armatimonadetes bacterium]|nr:DNA primase [Armatimonadota bacterium]